MTKTQNTRRPESALEVAWQRHLPQGLGEPDSDERVDAIADLGLAVERALEEHMGAGLLDRGDLVVTISRRPGQEPV
jgi:hypothetical protein